jgi:hypothetical protein
MAVAIGYFQVQVLAGVELPSMDSRGDCPHMGISPHGISAR